MKRRSFLLSALLPLLVLPWLLSQGPLPDAEGWFAHAAGEPTASPGVLGQVPTQRSQAWVAFEAGSGQGSGRRSEPAWFIGNARGAESRWDSIGNAPAGPRVEPELLKAALQAPTKPQRFIVYLTETASLAEAAAVPVRRTDAKDLTARRRGVMAALQTVADSSQRQLRAYLSEEQAKGTVRSFTPLWIANAVAVTAEAEVLFELAQRPEVAIIRADHMHWLPGPPAEAPDGRESNSRPSGGPSGTPSGEASWNVRRIRADLVWQTLGIDGKGVVIASMDTGVDWQHPALQSRYRGFDPKGLPIHLGNWFCATDEGYLYPGDGHGHGTHTTGVALGEGGIGVAPGARWIAVKVFHNQGYSFDSWLHAGFQWLLAPEGDPSLAPDIVNASWGDNLSGNEAFRSDVQALRAAGILPVFSAGNSGPRSNSVGVPAGYPEALAVGATDSDDEVAAFSSRGPSPWAAVKPDVVAPGAEIRSALPGGSYGVFNGTSMAVPHVAGLAALLLEAEPTLTITATVNVITRTAVPLSEVVPNTTEGWGRVDAYQAVASVAHAGFLDGRVSRAADGGPIPTATIAVSLRDQPPFARVTAGSDGAYDVALPPGVYDVTVAAFGYLPTTKRGVQVELRETRRLDFSLALGPFGVVFGLVRDAETGGPLRATLRAQDTPVTATSDPTTGTYSLSLPPGAYEISASSPAHRVMRTRVTVEQGQGQMLDFALPSAPTILLVDSGAWYYGSQLGYFQTALDDLGFLYDTWRIKDLRTDVPKADDLRPYEITIWSAPQDGPGFIGASASITGYLSSGGRLFLTGQDIGYWDGGGTGTYVADYFREYLQALYMGDNSGVRQVEGLEGGPFAGLSLALESGDGANNQASPDLVAPWKPDHASPVLHYSGQAPAQGGGVGRVQNSGTGIAGLDVGLCLPYRALYFAFGLEGISSRADRAEVMRRVMESLMAPPEPLDFTLTAPVTEQVGAPGSVVTYSLTLRNTGQLTDSYQVQVADSAWPASLWDLTFTRAITQPVALGSCASQQLGLKVEIPPELGWNVANTVMVTAVSGLSQERGVEPGAWNPSVAQSVRPRLSPWHASPWHREATDCRDGQAARGQTGVEPLVRQLALRAKTPAPVLLVDDDRWYNVEARYQQALGNLADTWVVGWSAGAGLGSPPMDRLKMYPIVAWFTGYDWYQTLTPKDEERLAEYLSTGGRLFLSSQDYFYTRGLTDFSLRYLGVISYTEDLTSTVVTGVESNPVTRSLGPYVLDYTYPNHSDALAGIARTQPAFIGEEGQVAAVSYEPPAGHFRTLFLAFPFEAFSEPDAAEVMGRALDWLSPLADSALTANRTVVSAGDRLTYTLTLRNPGRWTLADAAVTNTLPADLTLVEDSLSGGTYDPEARIIRWAGALRPSSVYTLTYQADLPAGLPPGSVVTNAATIADGTGVVLERQSVVRVNVPDLTPSTKWADRVAVRPGEVISYFIFVRNGGTWDAESATVTDRLPAGMSLVPGSGYASAGSLREEDWGVTWTGAVPRRPVGILITYQARVSSRAHGALVNVARFEDGFGPPIERRESVTVGHRLFLPLVVREWTLTVRTLYAEPLRRT